MEVVIVGSETEAGDLVADAVCTLLERVQAPHLGLATGSSPLPAYRELIRRHHRGISFAAVTAYMLDEYLGLPDEHPQQYRTFLRREFTDQVGITPDRLLGPDGHTGRPDDACRAYDDLIRANGGIDLQILGIGSDGHIAFNEPASSLVSRTRLKTLREQTRRDNARFFNGDLDAVPRHVMTQGIGTILESRHIVLIATGASKASSIAKAIEGPVAAMVPASALQLHPHVTIVLDEPAASELALADYFKATYRQKPKWQGL